MSATFSAICCWPRLPRRPPPATRFRPGQSGNPRGSRKRTFGAAVAAALGEKVDVKENGRSRPMTKLEAAAKQLANRAASGDRRAMQLVVRLVAADDPRPAPKVPTYTSEGDALVVSEIVRRLSGPGNDRGPLKLRPSASADCFASPAELVDAAREGQGGVGVEARAP
jgi:hypothetical protein